MTETCQEMGIYFVPSDYNNKCEMISQGLRGHVDIPVTREPEIGNSIVWKLAQDHYVKKIKAAIHDSNVMYMNKKLMDEAKQRGFVYNPTDFTDYEVWELKELGMLPMDKEDTAIMTPSILDTIINDRDFIEWDGWTTTFAALRDNGWELSEKATYSYKESRYRPGHGKFWFKGYRVYMRHPRNSLIARVSLKPDWYTNTESVYTLDFMINAKLHKSTPVRLKELALSEEDTGILYEMIAELQKQHTFKKKKNLKPLPIAEIIDLGERLKVA